MQWLGTILLVLLIGGEPDTKIISPQNPIKRGKNIVIAVQPPDGLVDYTFTWVISPPVKDLFTYPDNSKACFGSGDVTDPQHYDITLVASYMYITKGRHVLKTVTATTSVDIINPDGKYKLAAFVRSARGSLPSDQAKALAAAFRSVISRNADVPFKSKAEVITATIAANRVALGSNMNTWGPVLDIIAKQMDNLRIIAIPDIMAAFDELANGLEN